MTTTINASLISAAARKIAGCCWDDAQATEIVARLREVRSLANLGGDHDLTHVDRDALDTLIGLATGESFGLHNYQTGDYIRPATDTEVCECAVAQSSDNGVGAFAAEGTTCYVE